MRAKATVFLFILIVAASAVKAQDTLDAYELKPGYFCRQWPDFRQEPLCMNTSHLGSNSDTVDGKLIDLDIDDTITVYGIVVGVGTLSLEVVQSPSYDDHGNFLGYYADSTYYYQQLNSMCDTSDYQEAYEMWALYKRVADSVVRVSPQLPVNIKLHAPTYILRFNTYETAFYTAHTEPLKVYERFFNTPQVMAGPFYLGMTHRANAMASACGRRYYTWPQLVRVIAPEDQFIWEGHFSFWPGGVDYYGHSYPGQWHFGQMPLSFAFPIIVPPDSGYVWDTTVVAGDTVVAMGDTIIIGAGDTIIAAGDTTIIIGGDSVFVAGGSTVIVTDTTIVTDTIIIQGTAIVGGDTIVYYDTVFTTDTIVNYDVLLSISEAGMLGCLTAVMPNPAAETVRVVSSAGMSRVEVYSMSGKREQDIRVPNGSLSVSLDVSRWPAGTYLVRIHTPLGVATKKLIL